MKLYPLVVAAFAVGLFSAPTAFAQDTQAVAADQAPEVELEIARQIVQLGYPNDMREQMFFGTMDQMTAQMRTAVLQSEEMKDKGALTILDTWLAKYISDSKVVLRGHIPDIMDGIALAYADMFNEQELRDILAFVETPSGATFFARNSEIVSNPNFAKANQVYMNEVTAQLPAARQELMAQLMEYFADKAASN